MTKQSPPNTNVSSNVQGLLALTSARYSSQRPTPRQGISLQKLQGILQTALDLFDDEDFGPAPGSQ